MKSYPIWNIITACIYKGSKSYGVKETGEVEVRIGTSASNSYTFLRHSTTHRQLDNGDREYRFYIDGQLIKRAVLHKGESQLQFYDGGFKTNSKYLNTPIENGVLN